MGTKPARGDGVPWGQQRETVLCCSHHVTLTFVARTVRTNMQVQKLVNILKIQLYLPFGHSQLLLWSSLAHQEGRLSRALCSLSLCPTVYRNMRLSVLKQGSGQAAWWPPGHWPGDLRDLRAVTVPPARLHVRLES